MFRTRAVLSSFAVLFSISLAGCGGDDKSPTVTPLGSPIATIVPPTETPVPAATLGDIVWATRVVAGSNAPEGVVESYDANAPALYAVIRVTNLRANSVLSASWRYNDTSLDTVSTGVVPSAAFSAGYVQFHLERGGDRTWPEGTYEIAVSLDGKVVKTAQIEVRAP